MFVSLCRFTWWHRDNNSFLFKCSNLFVQLTFLLVLALVGEFFFLPCSDKSWLLAIQWYANVWWLSEILFLLVRASSFLLFATLSHALYARVNKTFFWFIIFDYEIYNKSNLISGFWFYTLFMVFNYQPVPIGDALKKITKTGPKKVSSPGMEKKRKKKWKTEFPFEGATRW